MKKSKIKEKQEEFFYSKGVYLLTDCIDSMRESERLEVFVQEEPILLSKKDIDKIVKELNEEYSSEFGVLVRKGLHIKRVNPDNTDRFDY